MLRVIAGELGGRRLRTPEGLLTRPTAERVRQALFNILSASPPPPGGRVLDLYAGTGALGIEALSRGAERAVFVEQDAAACRVLRQNLRELKLDGRALVLELPVERALSRLLRPSGALSGFAPPFHFIFADPPYALVAAPRLVAALGEAPWLSPDGVVIIEHAARDASPAGSGTLALVDQRRYGDTALSFFGHLEPGDPS